ncbi:PQQ-dependent sugar dehydrogenase [Rhodopila globiformis]|uniref:Glucose dehydrogenase n=1 Tax=Rhodopila globiformis TaxID=1071 RepID=A0A2S6N5V0_RHOGL|nr:PQQ-dependent sugar dehydrogenase [Rhodopila globiformis]PPQ29994.1 glucose dehydrogenase [Rhodopila globiformis]
MSPSTQTGGALAALATVLLLASGSASPAQSACSGDAGGLTLSPGFCATVFADNLGHARHMAAAANGTLYVNTWSGRYYGNDTPPPGGMLVALKDSKGSGKADQVVRFGPAHAEGDGGGTGIALYKTWLYAETNDRIVRYKLPQQGLAPTGQPEVVVTGMPMGGDHPMHPFAIAPDGSLYVDMGSATNSCQQQNRIPESPGKKPCTELETRAGIWRFDANKVDQRFSPAARFATGLRNGEGISFDSAGRVFATQHGRDQLWENWPKLYTPDQGHNEPAEELVRLKQGADFGWPECYDDYDQKKLVLAPEYGGDGGRTQGVCAQKQPPVAAFPAHWAPNDMLIYQGSQFPTAYKGGAFLAFHGSWNRAPAPQGGYNVVFQPMADGKASGPFVVFANGFAGAHKQPGRAAHRPSGLTVGPDGALYVSDDVHGRIWRITYQGGNKGAGIAAPAPAPEAQHAAASGTALPPEGIHPQAGLAALPTPPGASPDQVALGDRIFHGQADNGNCAGCHAADGKGTATGADLADNHWLWSNGTPQGIARTIETGVPHPKDHLGAMPPMGGSQLSQADVAAAADYVWALAHSKTQ